MNPIIRRTETKPVEGSSLPVKAGFTGTAQKMRGVVHLLQEARGLQQRIQKDWDQLDPYELAELVVELQGRVALLEGSSSAIEKIKKQAELLHFQFVFPIVLELDKKGGFAKEVDRIAKEIFQRQSLQPFGQLDPIQQKEINRYVGG